MLVDGKEVVVGGRLLKVARMAYEYEWIDDPSGFVVQMQSAGLRADVFSFLGRPSEQARTFDFPQRVESISVIPVTTFEHWWKKQINDKTRNMIRKSQKGGVEVRLVDFSEEFVRGIKDIYDESPLRQGKPFKHYGKDLGMLWNEHVTFVDRSQFVGAYYEHQLIGFIKLVHADGLSHLMQIISKKSAQNKAPTNALIAKAVELCAERRVPYLHYGLWSQRGLGDFKRHHAFKRLDLARYFMPFNRRGALFLKLKLHNDLSGLIPEWLANGIVDLRAKLYMWKYGVGRV